MRVMWHATGPSLEVENEGDVVVVITTKEGRAPTDETLFYFLKHCGNLV